MQVIAICAVGVWMYLPAQARQARQQLKYVALVRRAAELSAQLASRNDELERLGEERKFLVETASHDLRQPVHALHLLLEGVDFGALPASIQSRMRMVRTSVAALGDMLQRLMDVSQIERGTYDVQRTGFDLHELLLSIAETYSSLAQAKGLAFDLDVDAVANVRAESDVILLRRVISNLLSNAVKYTESGEVRLSAHPRSATEVELVVQDTGLGISSDEQRKVFKAYVRLGSKFEQRAVPGMGLGLAIVQLGAKALGLKLELQSRRGHGTSVSLTLPVAASTDGPGRADVPSPQPENVRFASRILVVEDDPTIASALAEVLRSQGYDVQLVHDALSAAELVGSLRFVPDLLITDYQLGEGDNGLELVKTVRDLLGSTDMPAILITGDVRVSASPSQGEGYLGVGQSEPIPF
ncbi:MAG: hybrid sensor histidine kinase/response regulator, partial [Burkholderiales bacterium]